MTTRSEAVVAARATLYARRLAWYDAAVQRMGGPAFNAAADAFDAALEALLSAARDEGREHGLQEACDRVDALVGKGFIHAELRALKSRTEGGR